MTAIVIRPVGTISLMGTKSVDRRYVERVATLVKDEVDSKFGGNQRAAARRLPLSQTQISDYCSLKPGKGLGLPVLLKLREYFNRSLDDLLGLDPLPSERLMHQIRTSVELLMAGERLPATPSGTVAEHKEKPLSTVTPIAPLGGTKAAARANIRSRVSSRKQNLEAREKMAAAAHKPRKKDGTG